jgi:hypothetical protein
MRRRTKWILAAVVLAPIAAEVGCRLSQPGPAAPPPPPVAPPAIPLEEMTFPQLIAALRTRAEAGEDPDLAPHADLLAAVATHALEATEEMRVERARDIETPLAAKWPGYRSWATIVTYVEPGADPARVTRAHRSFERFAEWTGQEHGRVVSRKGEEIEVAIDATFLSFGPKWRYRGRPIVRGKARINVLTMVPSPETKDVADARGLLIAFPVPGGVHVVDSSATVVEIHVPEIVLTLVKSASMKDLRERMEGLRHRWKELPPE